MSIKNKSEQRRKSQESNSTNLSIIDMQRFLVEFFIAENCLWRLLTQYALFCWKYQSVK